MVIARFKDVIFLLGYNVFICLITLFYNLCFCFWDTIIRVIKVKYKIHIIYAIKARYALQVTASL